MSYKGSFSFWSLPPVTVQDKHVSVQINKQISCYESKFEPVIWKQVWSAWLRAKYVCVCSHASMRMCVCS